MIDHQAFAQAAFGHGLDLDEAEVLHESVEDRGARDHDVGAQRVEPGNGAPFLEAERAQHLGDRAHLVAAHRVHALRRLVAQRSNDHARQVADRARRAEHDVDAFAGELAPDAHVLHLDAAAHGFVDLGADRCVAGGLRELTGQTDGAEPQ